MVEVSLTVGKLDASLALLLTKDHHLIEFPTILLPDGIKAGSIVTIKCEQDLSTELLEQSTFEKIQEEILNAFGTNLPSPPELKVKNITQTSCVLEWDPLELGTASIKNLILLKDDKKLGVIPQPLTNRTTKLSGLPIDKPFQFQLRLDTTAGVYSSSIVEVITHKMTDLSGITVCIGDFLPNDPFNREDIELALKNMGARPAQDKIGVDTTHYLCTREVANNPEFIKASDMNIPIVRPEWIKACERERRIVGVRDFYVKECVLPDIFANNYWKNSQSALPAIPKQEVKAEPEAVKLLPEPAKPETEVAKPEAETVKSVEETEPIKVSQPEISQPEPSQAEISQPIETTQPKASQPEASEPEVSQPEVSQPEDALNTATREVSPAKELPEIQHVKVDTVQIHDPVVVTPVAIVVSPAEAFASEIPEVSEAPVPEISAPEVSELPETPETPGKIAKATPEETPVAEIETPEKVEQVEDDGDLAKATPQVVPETPAVPETPVVAETPEVDQVPKIETIEPTSEPLEEVNINDLDGDLSEPVIDETEEVKTDGPSKKKRQQKKKNRK